MKRDIRQGDKGVSVPVELRELYGVTFWFTKLGALQTQSFWVFMEASLHRQD